MKVERAKTTRGHINVYEYIVTSRTSHLTYKEIGTNRVLKHRKPLVTSQAQNISRRKHVWQVTGTIERPTLL